MSYRRRFNLDEVLREWASEQVATSRDQRDPRRNGDTVAAATDGAAEEDEVEQPKTLAKDKHYVLLLSPSLIRVTTQLACS